MNMSSDILAYHLLKGANFSEYHKQLTREIISQLKYEVIKTQLMKISCDNPRGTSFQNPMLDAKVETI